MSNEDSLKVSLLLLRVSVFFVMLMWTIDKFVNPEHAAAVYEKFYFISGLNKQIFMVIGIIEIVILLLFLAGRFKNITYLAVLIFHGVSTLSSFKMYLAPFEGYGLLFFAAWPMLAACAALYLLRNDDTKCTI